jgi:hypothetical protein
MWPPNDPAPEPLSQRVKRRIKDLGFFGVSGVVIFVLILFWSARDWFGIY